MALGWKKSYLRYRDYFLNILLVYKQRPDLKIYLEILLSLVTVSFFSVFALRPTLLTIAQLYRDNQAKEELITKMDQKINNLQLAKTVLGQNINRIPIINLAVPERPDPESFVRQIEGLIVSNSLKISGFSISEATLVGAEKSRRAAEELEKLPGGAKELSFSLSVSGSFTSLQSFINSLENLRRPIKIDSLFLSSSAKTETQDITLAITGRVPYLNKNIK